MLFVCMHGWFHSLSPLTDGHINNILIQTVLDMNDTLLQLTDAIKLIQVFLWE